MIPRYQKLDELERKATPVYKTPSAFSDGVNVFHQDRPGHLIAMFMGEQPRKDAAFYIEARNQVPQLLQDLNDAIEVLKELNTCDYLWEVDKQRVRTLLSRLTGEGE